MFIYMKNKMVILGHFREIPIMILGVKFSLPGCVNHIWVVTQHHLS